MRQISFQHDFFFKYNNYLPALCEIILYEPPDDKTNKMMWCAHRERASAQSDQSLLCPYEESLGP